MTARAWRLLITEPADGATNMAIDEAIWRSRQTGVSPPTLRFFPGAPPARPTGGSAIYHDGPERELTYSVAATAGDLGIGSDLLETYRWIGAALLRGLWALGAPAELVPERPPAGPVPAFCFAPTGVVEIEVGGRKIVGSAQRRQGDSFLQDGAGPLGVDG